MYLTIPAYRGTLCTYLVYGSSTACRMTHLPACITEPAAPVTCDLPRLATSTEADVRALPKQQSEPHLVAKIRVRLCSPQPGSTLLISFPVELVKSFLYGHVRSDKDITDEND